MLVPDDVIPLLLKAMPSFAAAWDESENVDDGERLLYLDAGDFIRHLVHKHLTHEVEEFPAAFAVVERLVVEGDDYVRNLGVIGFLEGLQMMTVTAAGIDPEEAFRPLVGPVSERWWERINRFWGGEHDALQVEHP
ncbi:MAG TPA: hypothetical protein PKE56_05055 [Acidimicrobiales bacterium]|nr:hypothetical protein [Acidimicrobiales bacterium]